MFFSISSSSLLLLSVDPWEPKSHTSYRRWKALLQMWEKQIPNYPRSNKVIHDPFFLSYRRETNGLHANERWHLVLLDGAERWSDGVKRDGHPLPWLMRGAPSISAPLTSLALRVGREIRERVGGQWSAVRIEIESYNVQRKWVKGWRRSWNQELDGEWKKRQMERGRGRRRSVLAISHSVTAPWLLWRVSCHGAAF